MESVDNKKNNWVKNDNVDNKGNNWMRDDNVASDVVDIDTFMKRMMKSCEHKWVVRGAVLIGVMNNKKPVFGTMSQCVKCKDIIIGE